MLRALALVAVILATAPPEADALVKRGVRPTGLPRVSQEESPRIMYWYGKVNQHLDLPTRTWQTDPDGASGADLPMLDYCQKWYPATVEVRESRRVTIRTWREAGNINAHTATMMSFECVQAKP